jgi:hypothetical protein
MYFFFRQAKKAAAINGQSSSTIKNEPKGDSKLPTTATTSSPKIPTVKKESTVTPPVVKKESTTPIIKKEVTSTVAPIAIKKEVTPTVAPIAIKKEVTPTVAPIVIKKEPKPDLPVPKRKSTNVESDDDIPLVNKTL